MSTFGGILHEYRGISLDRFDGKNLKSTVYWLSHAHSDHMVGLADDALLSHLKKNDDVRIYCTDITKRILCNMSYYKHLKPYLEVLLIDQPTVIIIPTLFHPSSAVEVEKTDFSVTFTAIPAGHCPGSAMLLVEGDKGTVLYTGDFRLEAGSASQITWFSDAYGKVRDMEAVYCDTSFLTPEAEHIPTRSECESEVIKHIESHISISPNHHVLLKLGARIGYENMFRVVYSRLNQQIHIHEKDIEIYSDIPSILETVTTGSSQVHACCRRIKTETNEDGEECVSDCECEILQKTQSNNIRIITLSTLWFIHHREQQLSRQINDNYVRVCYSFHSSYSEIRDLIQYLNPTHVHANVVAVGKTSKQVDELLALLVKRKRSKFVVQDSSHAENLEGSCNWWLSDQNDEGCTGPLIGIVTDEPDSKRVCIGPDANLDDSLRTSSRESTPEMNLWSDNSQPSDS